MRRPGSPTPCTARCTTSSCAGRVAERASQVARDYSWDRTALETLAVYRRAAASPAHESAAEPGGRPALAES
jgi:hypothetical protein